MFSSIVSSKDLQEENRTSMTGNKSKKIKLNNDHLRKINKPFIKSIKSPDGDIIDCVLFHLQPAFDLPELKGKKKWTPPELPKGHNVAGKTPEMKQLWNSKGESCPNGTIPIRRTIAGDILRSGSISKFGKKYHRKDNQDVTAGHEHAIGRVKEGEFYGGKAIFNIWEPNVTWNDFSLSQMWISTDGLPHLLNTIEAGWHVYPHIYKDNLPRLFNFWTPDAYRSGCYNLHCPGFIQTSQKLSLGAAIGPISTYNGPQYDTAFMMWKDPKSGDWWLSVGSEVIGYWPATLFTDLQDYATTVEYGGEVYSPRSAGRHTSTEMGSGHFEDEGFGRAAYVRNLEVVDEDNVLHEVSKLETFAEKPNCYGVESGYSDDWGNYIYFGGPGYNPDCL
ncbi:hypothetical protein SSX86_017333 [Deinandra increscens subsp. villosa]|uniref:Neprosin PEP catalytic domain-containing protein n=1 Tax=Deinandra increscens subsp. villosa TaxID=3103831 RepID=A0AAP0GU58_9ASTR